jgi:hypothetical protein
MQRIGRFLATGVCCLLFLAGCAEDDDYIADGATEVIEITADDSSVPLGGGTVVGITFSFDQYDVFRDDGSVNLVVRLPRQLGYRANSAEIDGPGSRDKDVDPRVRRCGDGSVFLSFDLDEGDLDEANVPVDVAGGGAQLRLTVNGVQPGRFVAIEAAADNGDILFSCADDFNYDEQEIVSVE